MEHINNARGGLDRRSLLAGIGAAGLIGATGLPGGALAKAPQLGGTIPGWYRFRIGEIEATIISDGLLNLGSATAQFPDAPADDVTAIMRAEFLPVEPMMLEQNCMILNINERVVLLDSGMGADPMFGDGAGRLLANIAAAGITPDQVDDIVLTHAHPDHCWGLVDANDGLVFGNAQIHMSQGDFDFWTDEGKLSAEGFIPAFVAGARRNLLPYRDRIHFVEDGKEVLTGITAIATPGHSVGHTSYVINSGDHSFLNVGDVCHHYALLFQNPEWEFAFDSDPAQAAQTRLKLFDMAATDGLPMIGYHFPFPALGNIRRAGSAYEYIPIPITHG